MGAPAPGQTTPLTAGTVRYQAEDSGRAYRVCHAGTTRSGVPGTRSGTGATSQRASCPMGRVRRSCTAYTP